VNTEGKSSVTVALVPSFLRYNASAITATVVDKSIEMALHYWFGVDELIATPIGMTIGSILAFFLGRNWTFKSKDRKLSHQSLRFLIIAIGNITLNWLLVWFLRDTIGMEDFYLMSPIAGTIVGLFYSFPMQRYFVYK